MMLERKTVSIPRACEMVGVSRRTIYNWIAGGKIQYIRTAGGSVRIFADTLWREPGRCAGSSATGMIDFAEARKPPDVVDNSKTCGSGSRDGPLAAVSPPEQPARASSSPMPSYSKAA